MKTPDVKQRKLLLAGIIALTVLGLAMWGVFFLTAKDVTEMKKNEPEITIDLPAPDPSPSEETQPATPVPGGLNPGEVTKETWPSIKEHGPVPYAPEHQLFYGPPQDVALSEAAQWAVGALSTSPEMLKLGQDRVWEEWGKHTATEQTTVLKPEFHTKMMENIKHYSHVKDADWWKQNSNKKIVYKPVSVSEATPKILSEYWGEETWRAVFEEKYLIALSTYTVYAEATITGPDGSSEKLGAEFGVAIGHPSLTEANWQIEGIWQMR